MKYNPNKERRRICGIKVSRSLKEREAVGSIPDPVKKIYIPNSVVKSQISVQCKEYDSCFSITLMYESF